MANYPFKINIQTKNGTQLSYYSSSFATSAATNVSASAIVDSINALPRAQYTQSEAVPNPLSGDYGTAGANGGKTYLSASHDGPQSGSITFTDTEDSATNGGLDFYTFWGTKVCSVLGLPEGIPIYTENFKFSDNANDTTNYISGDVIADGITVKEGFKLSTQARVRGNLIFDDVFGEGFVQFVSGSTTKMTVGYNDDKDFYKIGGATNVQISGSSAKLGAVKATSLSGITSLNLGSGGILRAQQIVSGQMNENIMKTSGAGSDGIIYWNADYLDQNHWFRAASDGAGGYEGDNDSSVILAIDAGLGRVGINDVSPSYTLDVAGTFGVSGNITVGGTVDGIDIAGYLNQAVKTTSSPTFAAVTITGDIDLNGNLVGDDATDITNIESISVDNVRADADSANNYINLADNDISITVNGNEVASFEDNTVTFNESANDVNVRMEAASGVTGPQSAANMFTLDAGIGTICVGNTPQATTDAQVFQITGACTEWIHRVMNTGDSYTRKGMQVRVGQSTPNTANYAIRFLDSDGTLMGDITFNGSTVTYGTFTGIHNAYSLDSDSTSANVQSNFPTSSGDYLHYPQGTIVSMVSSSYDGSLQPINFVVSSSAYQDKRAYGVYFTTHTDKMLQNQHNIAAIGDGFVLVNNQNGDIEIGDYITTASGSGGYGCKQSDDLLHNYTVAKACDSVDWSEESTTYKLLACTYHCG